GTYLCVVTVKDFSGQLHQKHGTVALEAGQVSLQSPGRGQLSPQQIQMIEASRQSRSLGTVDRNDDLTVLEEGAAAPITALAHNGDHGWIVSGRGALSFRTGDFFAGKDVERMRLTAEGNLGIGVANPEAKLDVAGVIRTSEG